jgi:hypothetical protein
LHIPSKLLQCSNNKQKFTDPSLVVCSADFFLLSQHSGKSLKSAPFGTYVLGFAGLLLQIREENVATV